MVSFYPSASPPSKNQLAKESPDSVTPMVNADLTPLWISHRSLCPVRALCNHLCRTSDLRHNKEPVFVSFQERFRQEPLSYHHRVIDQATVILCYGLSDQHALTLHQVKTHDVRAFAASKALQSGASLEQSSQSATVSHISANGQARLSQPILLPAYKGSKSV